MKRRNAPKSLNSPTEAMTTSTGSGGDGAGGGRADARGTGTLRVPLLQRKRSLVSGELNPHVRRSLALFKSRAELMMMTASLSGQHRV